MAAIFPSTSHYKGNAEPATLLAQLGALVRSSGEARKRRPFLAGGLVVALAFTALFAVLAVNAAGPLPLLAAGGGLAGACAAVLAVLLVRANARIVDERRAGLAAAVVRCLACDLPPGGGLEVQVDFTGYHDAKFRTAAWPGGFGTQEYRQPWLGVAGRLADGGRLKLQATLVVRRKERLKKKGRKKIKEDLCEHVTLALRHRALPPAAPARWPDLVRSRPLPPGALLRRAGVKHNRLTVEVRTQRCVRVTNKGTVTSGHDAEKRLASRHTLLAPMLAAYHALHACRAG
jgi:hypothetical protein